MSHRYVPSANSGATDVKFLSVFLGVAGSVMLAQMGFISWSAAGAAAAAVLVLGALALRRCFR
ncbi:hypothetical protein [Ramlibacter alkalitolerans]|uniref:Major facilitator superfamily (MFS) profile domain-containing protein n=1 Tax=Ramlibacter alkalitolerans TaxID=2039631 RepID=A0ABS1JTV7_9BURK|nr:hypothetical protein [Ramlibacter alkalitolerans]MBL0427683.1 hypothetical protein [Ramlibacter alkalitolerans]